MSIKRLLLGTHEWVAYALQINSFLSKYNERDEMLHKLW